MIRIVFHFSIRIYHDGGKVSKKKRSVLPVRQRLADVANSVIEELKASRGRSTIDNYRTALQSLLQFAGQDLGLENLNTQLVEGWQQWMKEKGVTLNTISCYMRSLRSIVRRMDIPNTRKNMFDSVFTGRTKTEKRSLSTSDIQKLSALPLPEESPLQFTRDLFLFCFYALGMPFVDVAFLRKKQIVNGHIEYCRHKTHQPVRVKIEPAMQHIINKYSIADSPYVFPVLKDGTMAEYLSARNSYNRRLRKLSSLAKLSRGLTSYVVRHSWASMAYSSNVDLSVISKALGHTNTKTTMVYIREIDDHRIDKANHRLIAHLLRGGKSTEEEKL